MEHEFLLFYSGKCYLYCYESDEVIKINSNYKKGFGLWVNKEFSGNLLDTKKIYTTETKSEGKKEVLLHFKKRDGINVYILKNENSKGMIIECKSEYKIIEEDNFELKSKAIDLSGYKIVFDNKLFIANYYDFIDLNVNVKPICLNDNVTFNINYATVVEKVYGILENTINIGEELLVVCENERFYYVYIDGKMEPINKHRLELNNKYNNFKIIDSL